MWIKQEEFILLSNLCSWMFVSIFSHPQRKALGSQSHYGLRSLDVFHMHRRENSKDVLQLLRPSQMSEFPTVSWNYKADALMALGHDAFTPSQGNLNWKESLFFSETMLLIGFFFPGQGPTSFSSQALLAVIAVCFGQARIWGGVRRSVRCTRFPDLGESQSRILY